MCLEIFRYWEDDGLKIRTCKTCKFSEFKSPDDGVWIGYCTQERLLYTCDVIKKTGAYPCKCNSCYNY